MGLIAPGTTGFSVHTDDQGRWIYASGSQFPTFSITPPTGAKFYRTDTDTWYKWDGDSWALDASGGSTIIIEEADGSPTGSFDTLQVDSADGLVLTDLGAGVARVDLSAVPFANLASMSASKLLGRGDSGAGVPQEITLGSGLSMSGTTLSATPAASPDQDARIYGLMALMGF